MIWETPHIRLWSFRVYSSGFGINGFIRAWDFKLVFCSLPSKQVMNLSSRSPLQANSSPVGRLSTHYCHCVAFDDLTRPKPKIVVYTR